MTTAYDVHTFTSIVYWCALSEPRNVLAISKPTYGLAFDVTKAPYEIDQYLEPQSMSERMKAFRPDLTDLRYHTIRQPYAPTICLTERGDYADKRLRLRAVRFNFKDIDRRFGRLITEYFR